MGLARSLEFLVQLHELELLRIDQVQKKSDIYILELGVLLLSLVIVRLVIVRVSSFNQ